MSNSSHHRDAMSCGLRRRAIASLTAILAFASAVQAAIPNTVYVSRYTTNRISSVKADGTGLNLNAFTGMYAVDAAVDHTHSRLYWADYGNNRVGMANLDGTGSTVLFGLNRPTGVAVDETNGKLYVGSEGGWIYRGNLDGSGLAPIITNATNCWSIELDVPHNKIYYTSSWNWIGRANLDGSSNNPGLIGDSGVYGMGLDLVNGKIYWANANGRIGRANLDGSMPSPGFIFVSQPIDVEVDNAGGYLFWSNRSSGTLGRANLNGTGVNQSFVSGMSEPWGLAITIPEPATLALLTMGCPVLLRRRR